MSEDAYRLYSCDDHLDIFNVPRDLWTERLPARYREIGPRVVEKRGTHLWMAGDRVIGPSGGSLVPTALSRVDVEDDGFRASNPGLRLQDMDLDGIHASIVYGPAALFALPIDDPEHMQAALRAWNDWAAEVFNREAPDRLCALPFLPTHSPEAAVAELERSAALGHRGAIISPFEADVADPAWDRLWAAASEAQLPISFHIGGGSRLRPQFGSWQIAAYAAIVPMQLDEPLSTMVFAGALQRNPGLQLVLAESGVGWLPYFVARMDAIFEKHAAPHPEYSIRTRPSELFARQVYATFEEEPFGPELIPLLSPDNFMWACDYPHPDSTWPESRKAIEHALGKLPPETVRKVTSDNCRRLYGPAEERSEGWTMVSGRCLCGAVRYEIDGSISPIWLCHCSKCRRATGSAFHASAVCRPEQFRWLQGEDAIAEYADTSRYKTRFCSTCGSPVPSYLEDFGMMFLHAGGLDGDPGRRIVHHIFVGSKAPWYEILDDNPRYEEHKPVEG